MAEDTDRRTLLAKGTKIALATPPALALLLEAEGRGYALARSGGSSGGGGPPPWTPGPPPWVPGPPRGGR